MNFTSVRIIASDIKGLVPFYERITGLSPVWYTEDFAELSTPSCTLALASRRTMEMFGASAAHPADNRTAIIEFCVEDVDGEYEKLKDTDIEFVLTPTTQPWGNRSMLFRDPDGNLINFFTPVCANPLRKDSALP